MKQLDFYIDGEKMNYREVAGFPLSFSYSIDVVEDPSKLAGSHSKRQVAIPGDSNMERLFEEWVTAGRQNPEASKMKPARIEANGLPVFTGSAQLDEVGAGGAAYARNAADYKVGLFGNNANWFSALTQLRLADMQVFPDHDLLDSVVSANDNPVPPTDTWGYMLAKYKDWTEADKIALTDMTPFYFVRPVVIEAFRRAGYRVESEFFDTDLFKKLAVPVILHDYSDEFLASFGIFLYDGCYSQDLTVGVFNYLAPFGPNHLTDPDCNASINTNLGGNYDPATGIWTCPASGWYLMTVQNQNDFTYFTIEIDGVPQIGADRPSTPSPEVYPDTVTGRYFVEIGKEVKLVVAANEDHAYDVFWAIKPDFNFEVGQTVFPAGLINPDETAADLIRGITQAFGLMWSTDVDAQSVTVEPRDRYQYTTRIEDGNTFTKNGFFSQTDRDDLTQRVDLAKKATVRNLSGIKEGFGLSWKSDNSDANIDTLDTGSDIKFMNARYTFPSGKFQAGVTNNENPFFSKTVHLFDEAIKHSSSTMIPQIPIIMSTAYGEDAGEVGEFESRLLYFAGRRGGVDGYVKLTTGDPYDFPAAFMVNYNDPSGLDPSLSFGPEQLRSGQIVPGLMQRFHLQYLKRLEVAKQISEYVRWQELDVLKLSFRRKVLLNNELYILQQLNGYKPLRDDSSETVLLLDAVPEVDDIEKISSTPVRGFLPKA